MSTTQGSSVWVVGARGMLGSAIVARLGSLQKRFIATDTDLDIGDREQVLAFSQREKPEVIVNAAAYTRVDDAETDESLAFRVNGHGPRFLAEAAREVGASLLHFSTDYVFDGAATSPYAEDAPTAPLGAYGRSKLAGEEGALEVLPERTHLVRTSWLFGENGNNFVKTMARLMREREELKVVADQHGRPTYTRDLAEASLALVGIGSDSPSAPGLYHFANAGQTTWFEFTLAIHRACLESGLNLLVKNIHPVTTAEFPRPAPRPQYSVLDTARIEKVLGVKPRDWQTALAAYVVGQASDWKN